MYILVWSVRVKYKFRFKSSLLIGFGVYNFTRTCFKIYIWHLFRSHAKVFRELSEKDGSDRSDD